MYGYGGNMPIMPDSCVKVKLEKGYEVDKIKEDFIESWINDGFLVYDKEAIKEVNGNLQANLHMEINKENK